MSNEVPPERLIPIEEIFWRSLSKISCKFLTWHDLSIKWLYAVLSKSHIISIISHNLHFHLDEMNVTTLCSFSSHHHHSIMRCCKIIYQIVSVKFCSRVSQYHLFWRKVSVFWDKNTIATTMNNLFINTVVM